VSLTGLQATTQYEWTLRSNCSNGNSDYASPFQLFTTGDDNTGTCNGIAEWSSGKTYASPGNKVVYNGVIYQNKWWTLGDVPGAQQWGPWEAIGSCSASNTVASTSSAIDASALTITAAPNPTTDFTVINLNVETSQSVEILLTSQTAGTQEIIVAEENVNPGLHTFTVDMSGKAAGIYMATVKANGTVKTVKLVKY
jgi:hypothetical protein